MKSDKRDTQTLGVRTSSRSRGMLSSVNRVIALEGNARIVLIKPFSEEALLNAINKVLSTG